MHVLLVAGAQAVLNPVGCYFSSINQWQSSDGKRRRNGPCHQRPAPMDHPFPETLRRDLSNRRSATVCMGLTRRHPNPLSPGSRIRIPRCESFANGSLGLCPARPTNRQAVLACMPGSVARLTREGGVQLLSIAALRPGHGGGLPVAIQQCGLGTVVAHEHHERAVGCGQPVGLPVLAR